MTKCLKSSTNRENVLKPQFSEAIDSTES